MAEEHPTHLVLAGGVETRVPLTAEEIEQRRVRAAQAEQAFAAEQAQRAADLHAVAQRAADDPAFAALVRLVGFSTQA